MKRTALILLIGILTSLIVGVTGAQDDAFVAPAETTGVIIQNASQATFEANEDGTFTLTLLDVSEFNQWMIATPSITTSLYSQMELQLDWSATESLIGTAAIHSADFSFEAAISSPQFDAEANSFTYTLEIDEDSLVGLSVGKNGLDLPTSVADLSVFVILDADFATGLLNAREARLSSARNPGRNGCLINCNGRP